MNIRPIKHADMAWPFGEVDVRGDQILRRAWELKQGADEPLAKTWVGAYLVECPKLHAFWNYWIVSVVHLRDEDGVAPAVLTRAGATHELAVLSVDPASPLDPDRFGTIRYLMPPDVVEQFGPGTDAQALFVLRTLVDACVRSLLQPDSDFRRHWAPAVGAAVVQASTAVG